MKKYELGEKIKSLDELAEQTLVFFNGKVYHAGWFMIWPIRSCKNLIDGGRLFTAKRIVKPYHLEMDGKGGFKLSSRYKEILKLEKLLLAAGIPHTKRRNLDGWQILYPDAPCFPNDKEQVVCSVIEHYGSYGQEEDLLEIMGLCDESDDSVLGHLTAWDVYMRILRHWEQSHDKE